MGVSSKEAPISNEDPINLIVGFQELRVAP